MLKSLKWLQLKDTLSLEKKKCKDGSLSHETEAHILYPGGFSSVKGELLLTCVNFWLRGVIEGPL